MNLKEALRARRVPFREETRDSGEISLCCPFCAERGFTEDTRYRLGVNTKTGAGHCFNCNWASRNGSLRILGKKLDMGEIEGGKVEAKKEKVEKVELPKDFTLLEHVAGDSFHWYKKAISYVREQRSIPWEQLKQKKIGLSLTGRYSHRIIFPVYIKNNVVGIISRDFTGTQTPPYLNSPGEKGLYNIAPVKNRQSKIVIVEGVFDCLSVERGLSSLQFGDRPDVVALLGRSLTHLQRAQLKEYTDVILWPDNDVPGIEGMARIADDLCLRHRISWVPPREGSKDAGDLTAYDVLYQYNLHKMWTPDLSQRERAKMAFQE